MDDLITALQIFRLYANSRNPTHCEHDELWIMDVYPEKVSDEHKAELDKLGFFVDESDGAFKSFRFGSA